MLSNVTSSQRGEVSPIAGVDVTKRGESVEFIATSIAIEDQGWVDERRNKIEEKKLLPLLEIVAFQN